MARSSDSFIEYMNKAHPDTEEHLLECEECFEKFGSEDEEHYLE